MRLYATVSGVLLILSIIDFALAAPVLVQENRRAYVDVMHIPEDVITVLGKRGSEELLEELSGTLEKTIESSDAHASSSSLPPGPDKGSTNDVKAPALNPTALPTVGSSDLSTDPDWLVATLGSDHELMGAGTHVPQPNPNAALSAARPDPEPIKPTSSSSTTSSDSEWLSRYGSHGGFLATIAHVPTSLASGPGHELTGAGAHLPQSPASSPSRSDPVPDLRILTSSSSTPPSTPPTPPTPSTPSTPSTPPTPSTPSIDSAYYESWGDTTEFGSDHELTWAGARVPQPNRNPASLRTNQDPLIKPTSQPTAFSDNELWYDTSASSESDSEHELTGAGARVPQPNRNRNPRPSTGRDLLLKNWMDLVNRPSPKKFGQAHENQARPSTVANFDDEMTLDELRPPPLKRPKLASSIVFGQAHEDQVAHVQQPGPPSDSTISDSRTPSDSRTLSDTRTLSDFRTLSDSRTPLDPGAPIPGPSNRRLPIGSPKELDDEAVQAARYAAKGKAKELRSYSRHR